MITGRSRARGVLLAAALCLTGAGPAPAVAQQPATQDTSLQRSQERSVVPSPGGVAQQPVKAYWQFPG